MPKRRVREARKQAELAAAEERELKEGIVKRNDPVKDTSDLRKLVHEVELPKVKESMMGTVLSGINGIELYELPDGRVISINNGYTSIDGEQYTPNGAYYTIHGLIKPSLPTDSEEMEDDNGGLGSDFFTNQAEMKKQEQEIRQLTQKLSNGDPTVNAAAQKYRSNW